MKILCYFKPGPLEAAYVTARLTMKKLDIAEELEFLIDTGSSSTITSDRDVQWLGIDYRRLRRIEASIGIGEPDKTFKVRK